MDWTETTVRTTTEGSDLVSALLMEAGAAGTSIEDREDVLALERDNRTWDILDENILASMDEDVLVKAYFASGASLGEALSVVRERLVQLKADSPLDMGSLELSVSSVRDEDWSEVWKKYYKPFRVGKRLVVKPSWEFYAPREHDLIIELDPGMAFGTGTHETTFLCMDMLHRLVTPGCNVIDVGTGTGILAIAAAKLGARDVLAIDIDENAVKVAAENIDKNGLTDTVRAVAGDLFKTTDEVAYIVVSNIIADVVIMLAAPAKAHLKPHGTLLCSGIIREREDDVCDALHAAGYVIVDVMKKGEWVCLAARRKGE